MNELSMRREMARAGRLLYERDLLTALDGNISLLLGPGRLLTTPSGACKGRLDPDDMVVVDERGEPFPGQRRPSSELKMHLAIYAVRPDVRVVVHAHPPHATAFAVAGVPLDSVALAEVVYNVGVVPLTEYALPSTDRLARIIGQYIPYYQALLLRNHGVVTVGKDLWDAYHRMESVEHFARILLYAKQLGGVEELDSEQIGQLCQLRRNAGELGPNPLCDEIPPDVAASSPAAVGPSAAACREEENHAGDHHCSGCSGAGGAGPLRDTEIDLHWSPADAWPESQSLAAPTGSQECSPAAAAGEWTSSNGGSDLKAEADEMVASVVRQVLEQMSAKMRRGGLHVTG